MNAIRLQPIPLLIAAALLWPGSSRAEEPSPQPPQPPQVLLCAPLGAVPGQTVQIKARGLLLEGVTEVASKTEGVTARFLSHGKVALPPMLQADRAGDTEVQFELTLTNDVAAADAELEFIAPHGRAAYALPLGGASPIVAEIEPNPGFRQPQEIALPQLVFGQIAQAHDVDVYAVHLEAQQRVRIETIAQQYGSAMDPRLMFTDEHGTVLASNDDQSSTRDARIEMAIPAAGRYFVVVQDANDLGGDAHPYRLSLSKTPEPLSFVQHIAPILQQHCVPCHGARGAEGGYRLDSYERVIAAGDSGAVGFFPHSVEESESFRRITSTDSGERMPLDGEPLSEDQIASIRQWLEQGAPFDGRDAAASLLSQMPPPVHPDAPRSYPAPVPLSAIAFSPAGDELLVGGYYEITVWHPTEGRLLRRVGQVAERTYAIAMHPSGEEFAVACGTPGQLGEVRTFDRSSQLREVLCSSPDVIHDLAYNPAGDRLAVAGSDGAIRVFDTAAGELQLEITSHFDWVLAVAWSPDGSKIASASRDKTAKVFDAATGQLLCSYARHDAAVRGVLFHPSGEEVYSSGENQRWDRWKIADAERVRDMHLGGEAYKLLGVNSHFLVASSNNRVHLMKAQESDRVREFQGPGDERFLSVAADAASDRVAAGTYGGEVVVWDLGTGNQLAEFRAIPSAASE